MNNFSQIDITGIGCNGTIGVKDDDVAEIYPAGAWAGFNIGTGGLLPGTTIASSVKITTWLNGTLQETFDAGAALARLSLGLNIGNRYTAGFTTTKDFNELRITYNTLVGIFFSAKVYYPVLMKFCEGPALDCNTPTSLVQSDYPVLISKSGVTGLTLGSVNDVENLIDSDNTNSATIIMPVGVLATGYISVKNQLTTYPAGYFAGFDIENSNLATVELGANSQISTYLNGVLQETSTAANTFLAAPILSSSSRYIVGFKTALPFNEIRFTVNQPTRRYKFWYNECICRNSQKVLCWTYIKL